MFTSGTKLVCIKKGAWHYINPLATEIYGNPNGPKFNEIVTLLSISQGDNELMFSFYEYPIRYTARWFEPLVEDSILEQELAEISKPIPA